MKLKLSELEQIISEEVDAVVTPTEVSPLEKYIIAEQKNKEKSKKSPERQKAKAYLAKAKKANQAGNLVMALRFLKLAQKTSTHPVMLYNIRKVKRRLRRLKRTKAGRQKILLQRINKDSSGASKKYDITIKDLQTALMSIPDKRVQRFAKKAKPGKYDRNTYRAIVSFQRKYRGELQDKRLDGLVGPSTIGVLRKYDKSGTFSRKLDTKGVAISGSDKMLAGLDKVVQAKPGKARLNALVNVAINQTDEFLSYFKKLRRTLKIRGGMVQLEQQFKPAPPGSSKLSDTELASSKRLKLYQDFREAIAKANRKVKESGDTALQTRWKKSLIKYGYKTLASNVEITDKPYTPYKDAVPSDRKLYKKMLAYLKKNAMDPKGYEALKLRDLTQMKLAADLISRGMSPDKAVAAVKAGKADSAFKALRAKKATPAGKKATPAGKKAAVIKKTAKTLKAAAATADKTAASKPVNVKQDLNFSIKNFFNDASKGYDKRAQEVALKKVKEPNRKKVSQIFAVLNKMGGAGVKLRWDGKSIILTVGKYMRFAISADEANYIHGGQKSVAAAKAAKAKQKTAADKSKARSDGSMRGTFGNRPR